MTTPSERDGAVVDFAKAAFPARRFSYIVDLANPTPEQARAFELAAAERPDGRRNPTRKLRIWALWNGGASVDEIARELGTTKGTVGGAMVRMREDGWPLPYREGYPRGRS